MSLSLLQNAKAVAVGLTVPFEATGGTAPYTYSVVSGGAGGSIDSDGLYAAPEVTGVDTVKVVDALSATVQSIILICSPLQLLCDVIRTEMGLSEDQVYLWDQKIRIPTDSRLYVAVGVLRCRPFANNINYDSESGLTAVQSTNFSSDVSIDIFSRGPEARERKEELLMALQSIYAEQQQEFNSFRIFSLPTDFINLSDLDGAAIPYQFNITVRMQYFTKKTVNLQYYDQFSSTRIATDPRHTAPTPVPPFNPSDKIGQILWLRGDQATGSGASFVWKDMGPNLFNATPVSSGNAPTVFPNAINGQPGVDFDSAFSQYLQYAVGLQLIDASIPMSIILVGRVSADQLVNFPTVLSMITGANKSEGVLFNNMIGTYPNLLLGGGDGSGQNGLGVNCLNGSDQIFSLILQFNGGGNFHDPSFWSVLDNGVSYPVVGALGAANSTHANNFIGAFAGATNLFKGKLGEVIVYNSLFTPEEETGMLLYLSSRYYPPIITNWQPNIKTKMNWWFKYNVVDTDVDNVTCLKWPDQGNQINTDTPTNAYRRSIDFSFNPYGSGSIAKPTLLDNYLNGKRALVFHQTSSAMMGLDSVIPGEPGRAHWKSWDRTKPILAYWVACWDAIAPGDSINPFQMSEDPTTEDGLGLFISNGLAGVEDFVIGTSFGTPNIAIHNFYADGKATQDHCILLAYNGQGVTDVNNWKVWWNFIPQKLVSQSPGLNVTNRNAIANGGINPNNAPGKILEEGEWDSLFIENESFNEFELFQNYIHQEYNL